MSMERATTDDVRLSRLREASEWLLRIQDPTHTDADIDGWVSWCAADPENLAEFERVQGDWRDLDALRSGAQAEAHSYSNANDESLTGAGQTSRLNEEQARQALQARAAARYSRGAKIALAAAACAGALALASLWIRDRQGPLRAPQQIMATDMNRAATLPDGSRVILRPDSRLVVRYAAAQRSLDLLAGEAYFKVRHDRRHPFIVRVGDVYVTALGTAFDVRRGNGSTTVTVEEGIVKVADDSWSKKGLPDAWRVNAGYAFSYSSRRSAAMIAKSDVRSALRWRDGELAYVREPLGSVVEDLNRYSAHKIVIEDRRIAALPFTGTAFTNSMNDWLRAIQQVYPVQIRNASNGDIVLTSRP